MAEVPAAYTRVPYHVWRTNTRPRQGEHIVLVGPTGCGKTTVAKDLLKDRSHVVALATKVKDKSLNRYVADGYTRIDDYATSPLNRHRFIMWPALRGSIRELTAMQAVKFRDALDKMFAEGGWTVYTDELHYLTRNLGLGPELETYFHQGRSAGLTVVAGTQRPAWVPLVTFSSASHALIWKTTEPVDVKRLSGLARTDSRSLVHNMSRLGEHEFIAIDTRAAGARPVITEYEPAQTPITPRRRA